MEKEYLQPTEFIDSDSYLIQNKALEISGLSVDRRDLTVKLFYFVKDKIKYYIFAEYFNREAYRASETLKRGWGYCVQKAVLLTALSRALGIPAKICFADIINHSLPRHIYEILKTNMFVYHGYTEIFLGGKWIKLTPIFDEKSLNKMKVKIIEFNGKNDIMLPQYNEDGERLFEYIRYRGCYSDLPYEDIVNEFQKVYKFIFKP